MALFQICWPLIFLTKLQFLLSLLIVTVRKIQQVLLDYWKTTLNLTYAIRQLHRIVRPHVFDSLMSLFQEILQHSKSETNS